MFGKRSTVADNASIRKRHQAPSLPFGGEPDAAPARALKLDTPIFSQTRGFERSDAFYDTKKQTFAALIESIDLAALAKTPGGEARKEIREVADEILKLGTVPLSGVERDALLEEICNDVLGFGPLEPLLAQDDISDIMINGARECYIESGGRLSRVPIRFADNQELANICQRIASRVGRRVDESTPICDARLPDGSRVNIIFPPLALDGPILTIRKFRRDRITLDRLVSLGAASEEARIVMEIISRARCNVLISGGTGSGKTTLLNCMTGHISPDERIVTCEDAAELQLQQPHVVRLETRPPNLEGEGEVTMRNLVRNCLRMR
ncbi:MAG TPA: ATPase, T2SS/T4P/T4SS family, partial [Hyphomicrobiales bacterium]|nr:ATPase, T2SS/T4P/T4SS family [Hyphomicrobiales bacterium]